MKLRTAAILALSLSTSAFAGHAEIIHISTPASSMVLDARDNGPLDLLYYGTPVSAADIDGLNIAGAVNRSVYPAFGNWPEHETAIAAVQPDGNMTLDLAVIGPARRTTAPDGSEVTSVTLRDRVYPFEVTVNYRTYPLDDVIETWTEISNTGTAPVTLTRFDSAYLPLRRGNVWLTSFHGSWANEARMNQEPLTPGMKVIKNTDGARNSHCEHAEVLFSLDGAMQEDAGRVIGAALEWGGNYKLRIDTDDSNFHHFFAGINDEQSAYTLDPGTTFTTPPLALCFSNTGAGEVSRRFHRWARKHRIAHGTEINPILLNSWEGVYFNITEEGMAAMMRDIASMGGELFVMDDGWFGDRYKRDSDNAALGDWTVDTDKLPSGIKGLTDEAARNGIKFGIWIEPEMTNTVSRLYEEHPEYVIKAANRNVIEGRGGTQLVLDLSNPEVQNLVFNVVDTLLTQYPEIAYIKWDANAPVMQYGSQYLPADRQSHLAIDWHKGFAAAMNRIREKYPDVAIQACASGGGRANYGILPWFDEFWTSDNTDALQRVSMQWGTSYFFPAVAMGSHISVVPNHTTHRSVPLKFRADVAMTGRLGLELQPKYMSAEEMEFCRKAIATYKSIRPIVQQGDLYRLLSPYDRKGEAALMYVAPDKERAVFYSFVLDGDYGTVTPRVKMAGLDPSRNYRVTELNAIDNRPLLFEGATFSGRFLLDNGLELPVRHSLDWGKQVDLSSRVLLLEAI